MFCKCDCVITVDITKWIESNAIQIPWNRLNQISHNHLQSKEQIWIDG